MSRRRIRLEADYQKLYTLLFNKITDALEQINVGNPDGAAIILVEAQRTAEELDVYKRQDMPHIIYKIGRNQA